MHYGLQTFVLISVIYLLSQLSRQSKFQTVPSENNKQKNVLVHSNCERLQRNKQDTNVSKRVYILMISSACIYPNWLCCWPLKQLGLHRAVELCQYFISKHPKIASWRLSTDPNSIFMLWIRQVSIYSMVCCRLL